ncbi:MAG: SUMF1/EgtB/PvdO family nonheme iron enzyme [Paludibacteraceae bacterium]|nr:SUMF1/EgtB/PvdO family nonheme iron enzyme [Paludibacteraceae bacterium]
MKNISKLLCFLFLLILSVSNAHSQQLQIADFRLDETEQTANRSGTEKFDIDDNPCALLRLQTSEKGFVFDAGTIGLCEVDENQVGEIWVWLRPNTRFLSIRHAKLGTINRYEIPVRIEGKRTYYARLISGRITTVVEEAVTQQLVKFYVEPKDAMVFLDNQMLTINDGFGYKMMRFGTYDYRIELADYHPSVGKVTVNDPDRPHEVRVKLRPAFGWIQIEAGEADGGVVYIDNRRAGTAPLRSVNLASGIHSIRIVKDKYAPWEQKVTVEDEKTATVRPRLTAQFARVTFVVEGYEGRDSDLRQNEVNPHPELVSGSQAEIYINNQKRGTGSVTDDFGYGPYLIECRQPSHRTTTRNVEITALHQNQTITLQAPVPIYGRLFVESNAPDALIFIDGKEQGRAPMQINKVLIGQHTITLKKQGYADASSTVNVEEGKTQNVSITLQNSFSVTLSCANKNAHIYLRSKGEKDFRELGIGSWQGQLALGDYEAVTALEEHTDGATAFTVRSTADNRITLNPPQPKVLEKKPVTVKGVTFNMIFVKGGSFLMGATSEQGSDAESDEKPTHQVTLSDYYIGETEVTQELWQAVMGSNPSYFKGNSNPVEKVSWNDCKEFVSKLNKLTGMTFRLPTEAEWEYAARGGQKSKGYKYSGSNNLRDVAWYGGQWNGNTYDNGNSGERTHAVATKQPNELGIYDMSGNVWEWCQDWYGLYSSSAQTNPQGASSGWYRVYRGGSWVYGVYRGVSWDYGAWSCRVSHRGGNNPSNRDDFLGLRLVMLP